MTDMEFNPDATLDLTHIRGLPGSQAIGWYPVPQPPIQIPGWAPGSTVESPSVYDGAQYGSVANGLTLLLVLMVIILAFVVVSTWLAARRERRWADGAAVLMGKPLDAPA